MPDIANRALLAEVLQVYSEAANAERAGTSAQFRSDTLVPSLVQQAMDDPMPDDDDDEAAAFITSVNQYAAEWPSFVPHTAFQYIVCKAIGDMCI